MPNYLDIFQQAEQLLPLEKLQMAELLFADFDQPDTKINSISDLQSEELHAII